MRALSLWPLALWPLRACQGLATAAGSDPLARAAGSEAQWPAELLGGRRAKLDEAQEDFEKQIAQSEAIEALAEDAKVEAQKRQRKSQFDFAIESAGRAPRESALRPGNASANLLAVHKAPRFELRRLRWLHIPKTGVGFISTIWNYACGQRGAPLDLYVDEYHSAGCEWCYDFALMDRFPRELYCEPGVLSPIFGTQHRPASQEDFLSEGVVALFRRPAQRLISAHRNGFHASGLGAAGLQRLRAECAGRGAGCFARFPGVAGCSARMLAGHRCAEPVAPGGRWDGGLSHVEKAVDNMAKMRFVGLTEEWDESVCLFHVMFGGRISPAEFKKLDSSPGKSAGYNETELEGFTDDADELVYAAAKGHFAALKAKYVRGTSACGDDMEISPTQPHVRVGDASRQRELSCGARGAQCGLLARGNLDCGQCPGGRLGTAYTGPAPKCSAEGGVVGKCSVMPEVFSWHRPNQ